MLEVPSLHVRPVINLVVSVVGDQVVLNQVVIDSGGLNKLGVLLDLLFGLQQFLDVFVLHTFSYEINY
jgi:hypothetical protein